MFSPFLGNRNDRGARATDVGVLASSRVALVDSSNSLFDCGSATVATNTRVPAAYAIPNKILRLSPTVLSKPELTTVGLLLQAYVLMRAGSQIEPN